MAGEFWTRADVVVVAAAGAVEAVQDWLGNRVAAEATVLATWPDSVLPCYPCWDADRPVAGAFQRTVTDPTFAGVAELSPVTQRWPCCRRLAG